MNSYLNFRTGNARFAKSRQSLAILFTLTIFILFVVGTGWIADLLRPGLSGGFFVTIATAVLLVGIVIACCCIAPLLTWISRRL